MILTEMLMLKDLEENQGFPQSLQDAPGKSIERFADGQLVPPLT